MKGRRDRQPTGRWVLGDAGWGLDSGLRRFRAEAGGKAGEPAGWGRRVPGLGYKAPSYTAVAGRGPWRLAQALKFLRLQGFISPSSGEPDCQGNVGQAWALLP